MKRLLPIIFVAFLFSWGYRINLYRSDEVWAWTWEGPRMLHYSCQHPFAHFRILTIHDEGIDVEYWSYWWMDGLNDIPYMVIRKEGKSERIVCEFGKCEKYQEIYDRYIEDVRDILGKPGVEM